MKRKKAIENDHSLSKLTELINKIDLTGERLSGCDNDHFPGEPRSQDH